MGEAIASLICGLPIFIYLGLGIRATNRMSKERKVFKKMMGNMCDSTVLSYIHFFEKSYGFLSGVVNRRNAVAHRNDLTRQAQGYEIIKNSSSVSDSVKEQLKNVFIANGVPIKL